MDLNDIYRTLLDSFGKQGWWPVGHDFDPPEWEIIVGAVLTQNTGWRNVEKALENLSRHNIISIKDILHTETKKLAELVRPSGYYNQKAERLKTLAGYISSFGGFEGFSRSVRREDLLSVKGIGKETADSILLYALNRPCFVIDAYTLRVFSRLGMLEDEDYERCRNFFEKNFRKDVEAFKEFHALIVRLGKDFCRKKPLCSSCPLKMRCEYRQRNICI